MTLKQSIYLTSAFAAFLLAGCKSGGDDLVLLESAQRDEIVKVQEARDKIAKEKKIDAWKVSPDDVAKDPDMKKKFGDDPSATNQISQALTFDRENAIPIPSLTGYKKLETGSGDPAMAYTIAKPDPADTQKKDYVDVKTFLADIANQKIFHVKITSTPPAEKGKPAPAPTSQQVWVGPLDQAGLDKAMKGAPATIKIETLGSVPISLYSNGKGSLVLVVDGDIDNVGHLSVAPMTYFLEGPDVVKPAQAAVEKDPAALAPAAKNMRVALKKTH